MAQSERRPPHASCATWPRRGCSACSINLGNAVLAAGTPEDPSGVTVDLAREIAAELGVEPRLVCFDAARKSSRPCRPGSRDIGFLAIEPEREAELAFTAPYAADRGRVRRA